MCVKCGATFSASGVSHLFSISCCVFLHLAARISRSESNLPLWLVNASVCNSRLSLCGLGCMFGWGLLQSCHAPARRLQFSVEENANEEGFSSTDVGEDAWNHWLCQQSHEQSDEEVEEPVLAQARDGQQSQMT